MPIEYNKVTWYSKILALILFVALPFAGFWLGMKYANTRAYILEGREIAREQIAKQKNSTSTEVDTAGWKTYRNEEYGFEIEFSEEFKNLSVYPNKHFRGYHFCLPTTQSNYPDSDCGDEIYNNSASVFYLAIHTHEDWRGINSHGLTPQTYLTENEDYVFVYQLSQDSPEDQALLRDEVKDILSTFKFIDNVAIESGSGIIQGKVSIGPICPVERIDMPCKVNPEVYTSRKVIIYKNDQKTVVEEKNLNPDGSYEFSLPAGEYYVNVIPQGIGILPPKKIVVIENKTTQLDFDIDTGIR
jgi:hypothetical protein